MGRIAGSMRTHNAITVRRRTMVGRFKYVTRVAVASGVFLLAPWKPALVKDTIMKDIRPTHAAFAQALSALPDGDSGSFHLVTYNVAGLPDLISRSCPSVNLLRMGPLLSRYDLVLVQEDFAYPRQLRAGISLPFQSILGRGSGWAGIGDGLNRFSRLPFSEEHRESWRNCHGYLTDRNDCLVDKGFSVASHHLGAGAVLDVYNVHMDSGRGPGNLDTRLNQVGQLLDSLANRSRGRAVIIAGDTNLRSRDVAGDRATFEHLLQSGGLRDTCEVTDCPDVRHGIDKVLYRGSPSLQLVPRQSRTDQSFVDDNGEPLSDHVPIVVDFTWRAVTTAHDSIARQSL